MKILVAEDDSVSRLMLCGVLTKWGFDVVSVENGLEAMEALERDSELRLAILDWMMPELDGTEVCRRLRESKSGHFTYVIILTAKGATEDIVQALDFGADTYLVKPFDFHELRARIGAGQRIIELQDQLRIANERLAMLARVDSLTQVANRMAVTETLEIELKRATRQHLPISVAMLDVDKFKTINDNYGHPTGDKVLVAVAQLLRRFCRNYDLVGRYGGEEFLLGLLGADATNAETVTNRVLDALRCVTVLADDNRSVSLTASIGVCCIAADRDCDVERAIRVADDALYRAKRAGRDQAIFSQVE